MAELTIQQTLDLARQHHRSGGLAAAEQLYREILARQPNHPDALHLLGVIATQVGRNDLAADLIGRAIAVRPNDADMHSSLGNALASAGQRDEAIAAYRQSIVLNPRYAKAHYNLGNTLKDKGQLAAAVAAYRQAVAVKPDYAQAYCNLGNALKDQGALDEAIAAYWQAIALKPDLAQAYSNLGNALVDQGQLDEAVAAYQKAITLKPDYAQAYCNLGNALKGAGRCDQALVACQQAIALKPDLAEAHSNLGNTLKAMGRLDEAVAAFRLAIALKPDFAPAYSNLGNALLDQRQLDEAVAVYGQAIALKPDLAEGHSNLGNALKEKGQLDEAIAAYRQAIALKAGYADAHSNLGNALRENGELDQAVAACRQAIALKSDFPDAHYNLATTLLLRGELLDGWQEYEWRWRIKDFGPWCRNFGQPQWDGAPLAGRTLLLHAEQGLGDTLQFVRYLPLVVQRAGCGRVVLECQVELLRLLDPTADGGSSMLTAGCQVVGRGQPLPAFDLHCPLLSLPLSFASTLQSLPGEVPYLRPKLADIRAWRQRLGTAGDRGEGTGDSQGTDARAGRFPVFTVPCPLSPVPCIQVGLVWAGSPQHRNNHERSIVLNRLASLASVPRVRLVSLQKGPAAAQTQSPPGLHVLDLSDDLHDMADTAALIANLDLVISVDTAVAHLAGAMAKPVWTLLPWAPDWRWLLERDDSPWYPSMRLFRQPVRGDWDAVVARVVAALSAWIG